MTDWGAHHNDIAQWGLGKDGSGPINVTATGVKPSHKPNSYNCHPHFAVTYTYADGTHLVTTSDGENGNRFIGDEGWIFVNRERIEASDPKLLEEPLPDECRCGSTSRTTTWATSWTASAPASGPSATSRSATARSRSATWRDRPAAGHPAQLGPEAEQFVGPRADKGNAMISREMRSPWRLEV